MTNLPGHSLRQMVRVAHHRQMVGLPKHKPLEEEDQKAKRERENEDALESNLTAQQLP